MRIEITPFPLVHAGLAWIWLQEHPQFNFDDHGPKNPADLRTEFRRRQWRGESLVEVTADGKPVGIVGYFPISPVTGMLHGICFSKEVHGTGIPFEGVRQCLRAFFETGVSKISATYYADNLRVRAFLKKFGAVDEGLLQRHVLRNDNLMNMQLVAFHCADFQSLFGDKEVAA